MFSKEDGGELTLKCSSFTVFQRNLAMTRNFRVERVISQLVTQDCTEATPGFSLICVNIFIANLRFIAGEGGMDRGAGGPNDQDGHLR